MSDLPPDTFGSQAQAPVVVDPNTGVTYALGFDDSTTPPTPVWVAISTWGVAMQRWPTWGALMAEAPTWGIAMSLVTL